MAPGRSEDQAGAEGAGREARPDFRRRRAAWKAVPPRRWELARLANWPGPLLQTFSYVRWCKAVRDSHEDIACCLMAGCEYHTLGRRMGLYGEYDWNGDSRMNTWCVGLRYAVVIGIVASSWAQQSKQQSPRSGAQPAVPSASSTLEGANYSGMYMFLKDGEFVQVTVEDQGGVTGFVSRYGEGESDKGAFLDQFFKSGKLDGNKLRFTTETVHGVWFDFKGAVERGEGKNPGDEGYYVLKGTLTENSSDVNKKVSSRTIEVTFKMFPKNAGPAPAVRN